VGKNIQAVQSLQSHCASCLVAPSAEEQVVEFLGMAS
jgi:disulfide oxidoreductase YuzD